MFFDWNLRVLCGLGACILLLSCNEGTVEKEQRSAGGADNLKIESEYRLLMTELKLAETNDLYLALDFGHWEIQLKLKGVVIWSQKLDIAENDTQEVREFQRRFRGKEQLNMRPIVAKYLFASQKRIPDSLLTLVSNALDVKPDLLQREIPSRFHLVWNDELILDIQTDIKGNPKSKLKNTLLDMRNTLRRPFGLAMVTLKMPAEDALTLYRTTRLCMPTLLYPESRVSSSQ